jgi:hypothetical protein
MPVREIIFRNDELTVVAFDCGTDTVFATFNEMGMSAEGDAYWGSELFEGMGVSAVGFVSARPNWYPPSSTLPAIEIVRTRFAGRRIVTYGFSQGGYGALKFGKRLSSALTLAFSPQWSINPDDVGKADPRFISYYNAGSGNGERVQQYELGQNCFVLFDRRMQQDAFHADRILDLEDVQPVPIAFAGQSTVQIVSEGGAAKSLIRLCMESQAIAARDIRAILRRARGRSKTYAQGKLAQLEASAGRHRRFITAAIDALPEGVLREIARIRVCLSAADHATAARHLSAISDQELLQLDLLALWVKFRSAAFTLGETRLAPLFKQKYPENIFARLHGVNAWLALHEGDAASAELEALCGMPGASAHTVHFVDFYQRLGRPDEAARVARTLGHVTTLGGADRLRVGSELLQLYKKYAMRPAMFNELMVQAKLAAADEERLLALIQAALEIKSFSFIEYVMVQNPALQERHPVLKVYAVQCEAVREPFGASRQLEALFGSQVNSQDYWRVLSIAAEQMLGVNRAIEAADKWLRCARTELERMKAHARLAHLYTAGENARAALRHIKTIRDAGPVAAGMFGGLAKMALQNGNSKLAASLASACLAAETRDPALSLQCCQVLIQSRAIREAAAHIDTLVTRIERDLRLSRPQFSDLMTCCQAIDFRLEQRAVTLGARMFPDDPELQSLTSRSRNLFAAKFFPAPTSPQR